MLTSKEDIENDINETLEQLLQNSAALKMAPENSFEFEQLEKLQESLLARLMHRQSLLDLENRAKKIAPIQKEAITKKASELQKSARLRKARSRSRG
ncbi:MAG: hypothetical protein P0S96_06220 [Simkaniaceae bacterium]|nr:hypothetical protein [Candidatus Sacchlamyda saccharinae]